MVAGVDGACLEGGQIRAGAGLGESLAPDLAGVQDGGKVPAPLLVGAPVDEGGADQVEGHVPREHGRARRRILLVPDDALDEPEPAASVLLRPRDADPARRVHGFLPGAAALEGLAVGGDPVIRGIVQAQLGGKVGGEPVAELLAKGLLLLRVLEVHGASAASIYFRRFERRENSECGKLCP